MAGDNQQREFIVLYTHQKTKKSKRWQDGSLQVSHRGSRAVLFDDRGCKLDAVYVKPQQVAVGEELESERYLITIEEEKQSGPASKEKNGSEGAHQSQQQQLQQQLPNPHFQNPKRVPLKRKRTGFTVPRQVVKKLATANDDVQSRLPTCSSVSLHKRTGLENVPHLEKRVLFSTPFSKEVEFWNDSRDRADAVNGSQKMKQVSDHSSMGLNDQSQSYQTKENLGCTLPSTTEDSSAPPCFNVDTPKDDYPGHVVSGAPSFYNGLRDFSGMPNSIPEKENITNVIQKRNMYEKSGNTDLHEGIVNKEQFCNIKKDQFESQDQVFLSSVETSLFPVQETDQTHNTTAITKPSFSAVGKRSTSQILALLGKGSGKFKPPVKQVDSDWEPKGCETVTHASSEDHETLFHGTVTESLSVMRSEQAFSEDIDVMELLGRADVLTAVSCTNPLPDQFDHEDVKSSRITHEVLDKCSHETVQCNKIQTAIPTNLLLKPSKLGKSNKSVALDGSVEKLNEVEQDNGSSLQKILAEKNQGQSEKPKTRNQQDKSKDDDVSISNQDDTRRNQTRTNNVGNQTRNQIDDIIVDERNQDSRNYHDENQTRNKMDNMNVDERNRDCRNHNDRNQTRNQVEGMIVNKKNQDHRNQTRIQTDNRNVEKRSEDYENQTRNRNDVMNVDNRNHDYSDQDDGNQTKNQIHIMNDDWNQDRKNKEKKSKIKGNQLNKNQTYGSQIGKQADSNHGSAINQGDCNHGDSIQDSNNCSDSNTPANGTHGEEITQDNNNQDISNQDDVTHGEEINQNYNNQDDGKHNQGISNQDGVTHGEEINQECSNQGDGSHNQGISNQDGGDHGEEITQDYNNQSDGNQNQDNGNHSVEINQYFENQGDRKHNQDESTHCDGLNQDSNNQGERNHGDRNNLDDGNRGDEINQVYDNQCDGNHGESNQDRNNQGERNHSDRNNLDDGNHGDEINQDYDNQVDGNCGDSNQDNNNQDDSNHGVDINQEYNNQDNCDSTRGTSSNQVNAGTHCSNCYNGGFQDGKISLENHPGELMIDMLRPDSETAAHTAVAKVAISKVACALCGVELSNNTLQDMCGECADELTTGFESSWKSGNHSQENNQKCQLRVSTQDAVTEVSLMQNKMPDTGAEILFSSQSECCILVKHNRVFSPLKSENATASPERNCGNQVPAEIKDREYTVQNHVHVLSIQNQDKQSFQADSTNIGASKDKSESSQLDDSALKSASLLPTGYIPCQRGLKNIQKNTLQGGVDGDLQIAQDPFHIHVNTPEFPHRCEDKSIRMIKKDRSTLSQYPVEDWLRNMDSTSSAELGETRDCVVPQMAITLPRAASWDHDKQEVGPNMDLLVENRQEDEVVPSHGLLVHQRSKGSHQSEAVTRDHQAWAESSGSSTEQCVPVDQDGSFADDLTMSQDEYVQRESPRRRDMQIVKRFLHSDILKRMSNYASGEILPVPNVQMRSHSVDFNPPVCSSNSKWSKDVSFFDPVKFRGVARRGKTEMVSHKKETDYFNQGLTTTHAHRDDLGGNKGRLQDVLTSVKCQDKPCRMSGPAVKHSEDIDILNERRETVEKRPLLGLKTQNAEEEFCESTSRLFSDTGHHFSHHNKNKNRFQPDSEGGRSGRVDGQGEFLSPLMTNWNCYVHSEIAVNPQWLPVTPNKQSDTSSRPWSPSFSRPCSSYLHSIHQEAEVDENINEDLIEASEMMDQVSSSRFESGNLLDRWIIPRDHWMKDSYSQSCQPILNLRNEVPIAKIPLWEQTNSPPGGHNHPYPSLPHPPRQKRGPSYDEDLSTEGGITRRSDKKLKKSKRENYWNDPVSSGTVHRRPPAPTIFQASARRQSFPAGSQDGGYSAPMHSRPQALSLPCGKDKAEDEQWREATDERLPDWEMLFKDEESGSFHSRSEMNLSSHTTEKETVNPLERDVTLETTLLSDVLYPSHTAMNESILFDASLTDETVASRQVHNRHNQSYEEQMMEYIVHNESTIKGPFIWRQDDVPLLHQDANDPVPPYWTQADGQTQSEVRNILASSFPDANSLKVSLSPPKWRQDNVQIQSQLRNILSLSSLQDAVSSDFSPSSCKRRQDEAPSQSNIHSILSSSLGDADNLDVSPSPFKWRHEDGPNQLNQLNIYKSSSLQDAYCPEICQSPSRWRQCEAQNQFNTRRIFAYSPQDANSSDFSQSLCNLRGEMSIPHQNKTSYNQDLNIEIGRDISTVDDNGRWLGHHGAISTPSNSHAHDYPECTEGSSSQLLARRQYKGFKNPTSSIIGQSSLSSGRSVCGELFFPSEGEVQGAASLKRQVQIPASFPSVASYKQVFTSALKEHLNLILFNLAQRLHTARNKVDTQHLDSSSPVASTDKPQASHAPRCNHGNAAKMVCVKKEGKNRGRFFYACSAPRSNQCKFFMWADRFKSDSSIDAKGSSTTKICLMEPNAAVTFFKGHNVRLYYGCEFRRRTSSYNSMLPGAPAWVMKRKQQMMESSKKKLYLNLSRKESSTSYGKDDIWVISKDLTFDPGSTFLAKSVYHGPSSNNDVEIEPLACYSTSNWPSPCTVHAILACNASSELTCLSNLQEHVNTASVPILQSLISNSDNLPTTHSRLSTFKSPAQAQSQSKFLNCSPQEIDHIATVMIETHKLNTDQARALRKVARMFRQTSNDSPNHEPVTLIHGVFGAGKSFLLAVIVLFLVQLFKLSENQGPEAASQRSPWKVLIASTTNVAVDRILLGLLGLGFEDFIRVGSLRKIAKPVLPYSVHASDKKDNQEITDLYEMLKTDLTPTEKTHVRRSLERQRLGQNRDLLGSVRVVGVTCAACTFPCMSKLVFPVILLDECSQMTEPSSLLPIARFQCEKLVLVGDPKQLDPTIQGSEAAHSFGLEQTLFNRLIHQGYEPILLRTQYRCHPRISAIANCLFYDQQLVDGVVAEDRPPLTPSLPTLCFFSVPSGKECCAKDGSFYNEDEATFVLYLIEVLLSLGVEPGDVGVITLYKAQTVKISMMLQDSKLTNRKGLKAIQISTVDAFQGGEKGVIILSCVRTDYMGFADSDKRTNVALTRSKNHLFIVGNLRILLANNLWGQVINLCKDAENGVQTSKGFIREWTPKLEELRRLEEEAKSQKRGQRSKASQETSTYLEELEKETSRQKAGKASEISKSESPHPPDTSSPRNESPSFSPFSGVECSIPIKDLHVGAGTLCNSSPSYSPLSEVEESGGEDSFIKEHPPCFDIGGLEDILG